MRLDRTFKRGDLVLVNPKLTSEVRAAVVSGFSGGDRTTPLVRLFGRDGKVEPGVLPLSSRNLVHFTNDLLVPCFPPAWEP